MREHPKEVVKMRSIFAVLFALLLAAPCMAATRDVQSGNIWRVDWDTTSTEVHLFISATTSGIPRRPSIAVSPAGTAYVTWAGGTNVNNSIFVKRAEGGGWAGVILADIFYERIFFSVAFDNFSRAVD